MSGQFWALVRNFGIAMARCGSGGVVAHLSLFRCWCDIVGKSACLYTTVQPVRLFLLFFLRCVVMALPLTLEALLRAQGVEEEKIQGWLAAADLKADDPSRLLGSMREKDLEEIFETWKVTPGVRTRIWDARKRVLDFLAPVAPGGEGRLVLAEGGGNGAAQQGLKPAGSLLEGSRGDRVGLTLPPARDSEVEDAEIGDDVVAMLAAGAGVGTKKETTLPVAGSINLADLEKRFRKAYTFFVYHENSFPCDDLVKRLVTMAREERWDAVPWCRLLSRGTAWRLRQEKRGTDEEVEQPPSAAQHAVRRLLEVRSTAMAMLGCGHLTSWSRYVVEFLDNYSQRPPDDNSRSVSVAEAEWADQRAWRDLTRLVSQGYSWDAALAEVVNHRDALALYLLPKPKGAPKGGGGRQGGGGLGQGHSHGQGNGSGRGQGDGKRRRVGEKDDEKVPYCFDFQEKRCSRSSKDCRFKHICRFCSGSHAGVDCKDKKNTKKGNGLSSAEPLVVDGTHLSQAKASVSPVRCAPCALATLAGVACEVGSFVRAEGCGHELVDGGGLHSSAVWLKAREPDSLHLWRETLKDFISEFAVLDRVDAWKGSGEPLLSDREVSTLRRRSVSWLTELGFRATSAVAPGQPFALDLLRALLELSGDVDCGLPAILQEGVPTGVGAPIEYSGVFSPAPVGSADESAIDSELVLCEANWNSAAADERTVLDLLAEDVEAGFAEEWSGGLEAAHERFGDRVAIGRLAVIRADDKPPRLVGDLSACGVNGACRIHERITLPTPAGVRDALGAMGADSFGVVIDVKSAHKRVKVCEADGGLQFFLVGDRLFRFRVNNFGGRWAAYWWARVAGAVHRVLHRTVADVAHAGVIYVDDWLWLFSKAVGMEYAVLLLVSLQCLGVPLSWRKVKWGTELDYLGWRWDLRSMRAFLPDLKREKLLGILRGLSRPGRLSRKSVEKSIGFLLWFSALVTHWRPWLSVFYALLRAAGVTAKLLSHVELDLLAACCDDNGVVISVGPPDVLQGWRVLSINGVSAGDVGRAVWSRVAASKVWVRFSTPPPLERVKLSSEAVGVAVALRSALTAKLAVGASCQALWSFPGRGAADAWADERSAGLGGWWCESDSQDPSDLWYFHLDFELSDFPAFFEMPTKMSSAIAALECLAQALLAFCRIRQASERGTSLSGCRWQLCQSCDNVGAVARLDSFVAVQTPMARALQLACWSSTQGCCELHVAHIAGVRNTVADHISRWREPASRETIRRLRPCKFVEIGWRTLMKEVWPSLAD